MTNIAQHIRIFEAGPTDDFVTKRANCVTSLSDAFRKKKSWADLIGLANDIASIFAPHAKLSDALATQVADAISKESPSFDKGERPEEIQVCAALGVLTWLENTTNSAGQPSRADIVGMALWSALSFQKASSNAKLEKLRQELVEVARRLVLTSAESSRLRTKFPETAFALAEGDQAPQIDKKIGDTIGKSIEALRVNAALDREEIDVLWWTLSDWSKISNQRYSAMGAEQAILVGTVELVKLLKRLPTDAHRHLVMRHVINTAQKRDLPGFLGELGDTRSIVGGAYQGNALIGANLHVFPLLTALNAQDPKPSGGRISRTLDEWGACVLLEAGLVHLSTLPALIS